MSRLGKQKMVQGFLLICVMAQITMLFSSILVSGASGDPLRTDPLSPLDPMIVKSNIGQKLTWEVQRSVGIFATNQYHIRDRLAFSITDTSAAGNTYLGTMERYYWRENTWIKVGDNQSSAFYVIHRNWQKSFKDEVLKESSQYFCRHPRIIEAWADVSYFAGDNPALQAMDGQQLLNFFMQVELDYINAHPGTTYSFWRDNETAQLIQKYAVTTITNYAEERYVTSEYKLEWVNNRFIDITTFRIYLDDKNYETFRYTTNEGILLSRETNFNIANASSLGVPYTGAFQLNLVHFTQEFKVSIWHYIIWFGIVFGSFVAVIIVLSIIVSAYKRKQQLLDY